MTDNQTDDPQRQIQRLTEELARKEREIEELKSEVIQTKTVGDSLWTHEIYIRARKKLAGGVILVLGLLSAVGLITVTQLYQSGVEYVDGEMKMQIAGRIQKKADDMVEAAGEEMDRQISKRIKVLIEEKKAEIGAQIAATQQEVDLKLAASAEQATGKMTALVEEKKAEFEAQITATQQDVDLKLAASAEQAKRRLMNLVKATEQEIKIKIEELEKTIQDEGDALSRRVKEIRIAMTSPTEAKRSENPLPKTAVDCDPNYLDADQIARVAVRQLSKGTGRFAGNGREVFKNTLFLDVRGTAETASATAEASCILDGVDRVVYGVDPNWYRPSEFVSIDRENEYRFTISGWGPTVITAQLYFTGRRESVPVKGNLAISPIARADKKYLGDTPLEFQ